MGFFQSKNIMSKVSKKSAPGGLKPSKPEILSKEKGASVTKPSQSSKSKSKELGKEVAAKSQSSEKKHKKVAAKEPTPEPESEEDDDDDSEGSNGSSEAESESEVEFKNNGANGVKVAAKEQSAAESSDESDSDEAASEDEVPKVNGSAAKLNVAAETSDADEDSDELSNDNSDNEKPAVNATAKTDESGEDDVEDSSEESASDEEGIPAKTNGLKQVKAESNEEDDSSEGDSDDSGSDDSEDEAEEEPKVKPAKRKADAVEEPAAKKSKVDTEDDKPASANLFVGNLSWNVDESWLTAEFEEFGELAGVRLITDRESGRSKGYGYVEFVNVADAKKAHTAKQGGELDGRPLNVDYANQRPNPREKQENRSRQFGDQESEPSETIFLGNLSFDATEDDVYNMFAPFGTATGVRIPTDPETGRVKGFGYVTFASVDEARAAKDGAQGSYLNNRPVRLDFASSRRSSDGPSGGRGRGGFGRGGFGDRGGRGGFGGRGGRGGRGGGRGDFGRGGGRGRGAPRGTTNRGGFGDFSGTKVTF